MHKLKAFTTRLAALCLAAVLTAGSTSVGFHSHAEETTSSTGSTASSSAAGEIADVGDKSALQIAIDAGNDDLTEAYQPKSAIVVEPNSGRVLFSQNANAKHVPASLTKLMSLYLIYQAMRDGKFDENTKVAANDKYIDIAGRHSLSNHTIAAGQEFTVRELIDALIVPSSAAATLMLADLVSPDDVEGFTKMMNETAARLGMVNTHYENPVGAPNSELMPYIAANRDPNGDNYTTAADYAILASRFVTEFPEVLQHTSSGSIVLSVGTDQEASYSGHNYSLPGQGLHIAGMDGFKTGSSPAAGYNVVATAKRDSTRLVAVVLGVSSWVDNKAEYNRARIANALIEDAFSKYEYRVVLSKDNHEIEGKEITTAGDLWFCGPKGSDPTLTLTSDKVTVSESGTYLAGYSAPATAFLATAGLLEQQEKSNKSPTLFQRVYAFFKYVLIAILILALLFGLFIAAILVRNRIILAKRRRRRAGKLKPKQHPGAKKPANPKLPIHEHHISKKDDFLD
ncbi:MAG: DUF1958 domain-containing protein [Eubacteriales bacterium]|nr:DUF1958 domain-containing protein [Eubacteriales bacterium]